MLEKYKIGAFKRPVSDLADNPKISAGELKRHFDSNSYELRDSLNGVIDDLSGENSLSDFKLNGKTVSELLDEKADKSELEEQARKERQNLNNYGDRYIYPSDESLFEFELSNDERYYVLTGLSELCTDDITELVIPYEYNGLPVKGIGYHLVWEESVGRYEKISTYSFEKGKSVLKKIILPDSITDMGNHLFADLKYLTEVRLSQNCGLGMAAFYGCSAIKEIELPERITGISYSYFEDCSSLTHLKLPESIKSIDASAFKGCTNLRLYIPDSVTDVSYWNDSNFKDVKKIIISPDNTYLREELSEYNLYFSDVLSKDISNEDTIKKALKNLENYGDVNIYPSDARLFLFSKTQDPNAEQYATIYGLSDDYNTDITELVIPYEYDGLPVKGIGYHFVWDEDFEEYEKISTYPFEKGKSVLKKIILPDSVTEIVNGVFSDCIKLKEARLSKNARFGMGTFSGCSSIEKIELPEGQTDLGTQCFYNCSSLKELIVPNTVTKLYGFEIFTGCTSLTLYLPDSITFIEDIDGCSMGFEDLKSIVISPNNEFLKEALKDYNLYFDYVRDGYYATTEEVGEISAALDELHTYAQTLAGGEA